MTANSPQAFENAVHELAKLPGIGDKTAERLAFHLLSQSMPQIETLSKSLVNLKAETRECKICHNLCSEEICRICQNPKRQDGIICVVEMPQDLFKIEELCDYQGKYHVLGGRYAPLEGIFPEDLNIDTLQRRIKQGQAQEIILAINPNTEGEATCELIIQQLQPFPIKITRFATGMTHGSEIEWSGRSAIQDAFRYRREVN